MNSRVLSQARQCLLQAGAALDGRAGPCACATASQGMCSSPEPAETAPPPQSKQRFYASVHVRPAQGASGYQVLLDARPVRTPGRHPLIVPSQALAMALAAEWQWQESSRLKLHTMPLMSLAATAIDQPKPRDKVIATLLKYVHTDATCCRVESRAVAAKQAEPSDALFTPPPHPSTVQAVRQALEAMDAYHLAAMEQLTAVCKSVVIAAALLRGHISVQEALRAARVEEDCQMQEWGAVEAGHDLDIADMTTRVHAPSLFVRLLALRP